VPRPVLALDIGGTKLTAGVITPEGEVMAHCLRPTDAGASPPEILETLLEMAEEALSQAPAEWNRLAGIGLSFGGPVDFTSGRTITCHHLAGWDGVPLRHLVAERAGLPVVMDNDANAAALGETVFGAGKGCRHLLYLTVSTGIGAGLILDGGVYRGANSMAGEMGHIAVAPGGPVCTCGRRGCLEAVAAGPAIARAAREALAHEPESILAAVPSSELTARHVAEAAESDAVAARIMTQVGEYLGTGIACAVNLLNPEVVVIGGGVSQAGDLLLAPAREVVARLAAAESGRHLRIVAGELDPLGALLGAAALALAEGGPTESR